MSTPKISCDGGIISLLFQVGDGMFYAPGKICKTNSVLNNAGMKDVVCAIME
ncbi:MAG: hypothetical protein ACI4TW_07040 [Prevotella sp.]